MVILGTEMKRVFLGVWVCGALASGACASVGAKVPADRPALEVPAPPARIIEPGPRPEPIPEPVGELPPPPATPRPRPAAPREPARPEPKVEPPPIEAPPPVAPVTPPPQLRTSGTADGAEALRQVREILDRANKTLKAIDVRKLQSARREQYNTARLLITQSEDALKASNFDIARNLADKADRIAKELQTR